MNIFAGILLLAAVIVAAVGIAYLYIGEPGNDTLWKCTMIWALLFSASFLPWGAIVGGPVIKGRGE